MSKVSPFFLSFAALGIVSIIGTSARGDAFAHAGSKLTASDLASNDELGFSIDLAGETLVAGARHNNDDGTHSGSAYVFQRDQGGANQWGETRKLLASDGGSGDEFGYDVAISGNLIIVGAPFADSDDGAAYLFERDHGGVGNWGQIFKLSATNGSADEEFGLSVDIDGDYCVVGAHFNDVEASHAGAAYIFQRSGSGTSDWVQVARLTADDAALNDEFGFDVAIDGDTVVVGSPLDNVSDPGSAYIFERNQGGVNAWGQVRRIESDNLSTGDEFGTSVAIHGDRVAVGAPYEDSAATQGGAVYLFERDEGGSDQWGQVAHLTADDAQFNDRMGLQVALFGNLVVGGAMEEDRPSLTSAGAAYLFYRNQGGIDTWGQAEKLVAYDANGSDNFGSGVTVGGGTAMIGAVDDNGGSTGSGSVYPFRLSFNNPPSIEAQTLSVPENSPNGTEVGTIVASPEDGGQLLSFQVLSGNISNAFAVHPTTGMISVNASNVIDRETYPEFQLDVRVTDNGDPVLSENAIITVELSDVPEDADLEVTQGVIGTGFAGDSLAYRVRVENHGPLVATNVVVRDFLPVGATPSGIVTNELGDIEAGEDAWFTVSVQVDSSRTAPLTNRVVAVMDTPDPDAGNNTSIKVTPITRSADLQVTKTGPAFVSPGGAIFYSVVVSNAGPSDASSLTVIDTLPPGLTTSGSVTNTLPGLAAGGAHFFGIPVQSDGVFIGELTNRVTVSSSSPDPDDGNNTAQATTTVNYVADIGIGKIGPSVVTDTNQVQYVLSVTNFGPSVAQNIVITDILPPGMVFTPSESDPLCSQDGSNVVCQIDELAPAWVVMLVVEATLDPATTGAVLNVAEVTTSSIDGNAANDIASAATLLPDADGDGIADFADPDDDNDAIPDAWERLHGLNPYVASDATDDPDGDQFINRDEYIADTLPNDENSYLFVVEIAPEIVVEFDSSSNRTYSLEHTGDPAAAPWLPVPGQTNLPGIGGPQRITNAVPSAAGHYRIRAHAP